MEDYEKAIADYSAAIRLAPDHNTYCNRGEVYEQKGDYEKAIADYSAAIRLAPYEPYNYRMRGDAYYQKGEYEKAIADYDEVIQAGHP